MKERYSMAREGGELTPEMVERKAQLEALLARHGQPLRDDSRLASQFIRRGGDVALVAHEILCVNYLFENTRYDEHCQTGLKQIADHAHSVYPQLPWSVIWSVVREYGVPAMKFFALAESGRTMPYFHVAQ